MSALFDLDTLKKAYNDKQIEIVKYEREVKPRHYIFDGSVRSGKTIMAIDLWIKHISKFKDRGVKFIMTGYTVGSLKKNVLDEITARWGFPITLNTHNEFKLFGNTICCFGTDKADSYKSITGLTAFGHYANEISLSDPEATKEAYGRCSGKGARFFWETNPDHPLHNIKINYIDRSDGVNIKNFHFTLDDNARFLTNEYIENLKNTTPSGVWYNRKILGLWASAEKMIYQDFNPDIHMVDKPDYEAVEYFAGVDWGFEHNGVIVIFQKDYDGNYTMIEEIVATQKSIDWWIEQGQAINEKYGFMNFYCDTARPDYINDFRTAGLNAMDADKAVIEGISYMAGLYKNKKIKVCSKCREFQKEIYNYQWDVKAAKEQPIKENDDVMDAMRYALYSNKSGGLQLFL